MKFWCFFLFTAFVLTSTDAFTPDIVNKIKGLASKVGQRIQGVLENGKNFVNKAFHVEPKAEVQAFAQQSAEQENHQPQSSNQQPELLNSQSQQAPQLEPENQQPQTVQQVTQSQQDFQGSLPLEVQPEVIQQSLSPPTAQAQETVYQ